MCGVAGGHWAWLEHGRRKRCWGGGASSPGPQVRGQAGQGSTSGETLSACGGVQVDEGRSRVAKSYGWPSRRDSGRNAGGRDRRQPKRHLQPVCKFHPGWKQLGRVGALPKANPPPPQETGVWEARTSQSRRHFPAVGARTRLHSSDLQQTECSWMGEVFLEEVKHHWVPEG